MLTYDGYLASIAPSAVEKVAQWRALECAVAQH